MPQPPEKSCTREARDTEQCGTCRFCGGTGKPFIPLVKAVRCQKTDKLIRVDCLTYRPLNASP